MADLGFPAPTRRLARAVEAFFVEQGRDLPWRADRSPYRVWLSEIMCQQTRVQVAIDYFTRFVERFPRVEDLARAPLDDVLAMWSGLGYYARGRNLHRAAQVVAFERDGRFPDTAAGLRELPGVGPYTAAAIASFAFGRTEAVVDGNVMRVLSRLCLDDGPLDEPATKRRMTARALALAEAADHAPTLAEGVMELGALVCTPKAFRCDACPLSTMCEARDADVVALYPVKKKPRPRTLVEVCAVVVHQDGAVWLERREAKGLFGGLYEVPATPLDGAAPAKVARQLLEARGLSAPGRLRKTATVARTLTHRELVFHVYSVPVDGAHDPLRAGDEVSGVGLSTAMREVLRAGWPAAERFLPG